MDMLNETGSFYIELNSLRKKNFLERLFSFDKNNNARISLSYHINDVNTEYTSDFHIFRKRPMIKSLKSLISVGETSIIVATMKKLAKKGVLKEELPFIHYQFPEKSAIIDACYKKFAEKDSLACLKK